jgi:hypothetical protein
VRPCHPYFSPRCVVARWLVVVFLFRILKNGLGVPSWYVSRVALPGLDLDEAHFTRPTFPFWECFWLCFVFPRWCSPPPLWPTTNSPSATSALLAANAHEIVPWCASFISHHCPANIEETVRFNSPISGAGSSIKKLTMLPWSTYLSVCSHPS